MSGLRSRRALSLCFAGVPVRVETNDAEIQAALARYYRRWLGPDDVVPVSVVRLLHGAPVAHLAGPVRDVGRADARRVKEAYRDRRGRRLIVKRATGVVMSLRPGGAVAIGDLRRHLNQGINLVNACFAAAVLADGYVLLHASAVAHHGRAAVLAGPPGAGKSTAALHLVEAGFQFVSNDRVLARPHGADVEIIGYPKQPRVNPGTLLHHPRLSALLDVAERAHLRRLPSGVLRELEQKRDVDVDAIYGEGTTVLTARMEVLILLRWRPDGDGVTTRELTAAEALANTPLFAKTLGVFDVTHSPHPEAAMESARYVPMLERVAVLEVGGRVDVASLVDLVCARLR